MRKNIVVHILWSMWGMGELFRLRYILIRIWVRVAVFVGRVRLSLMVLFNQAFQSYFHLFNITYILDIFTCSLIPFASEWRPFWHLPFKCNISIWCVFNKNMIYLLDWSHFSVSLNVGTLVFSSILLDTICSNDGLVIGEREQARDIVRGREEEREEGEERERERALTRGKSVLCTHKQIHHQHWQATRA